MFANSCHKFPLILDVHTHPGNIVAVALWVILQKQFVKPTLFLICADKLSDLVLYHFLHLINVCFGQWR